MGYSTEPDPTCNDCLCCWGAGETPCKVYISFVGLEGCGKLPGVIPEPINGIIEANQDGAEPCIFMWNAWPWIVEWRSCWGDNCALYQTWWIEDMFKDFHAGNCDFFYLNTLNCIGAGTQASGGNAIITWHTGPTDHAIGSLLNSINMEPHAETKFEFWPASEERMCVRFARKKDATNILILVEPTEL